MLPAKLKLLILFFTLSLQAYSGILVRPSADGLLSVIFSESADFQATSGGSTDTISLVLEDAYTASQPSLSEEIDAYFLSILLNGESLGVNECQIGIGQGTASGGTVGVIDPQDLVVSFSLVTTTVLSTDDILSFEIGSVQSSINFPAPDNLSLNTKVLVTNLSSSFQTDFFTEGVGVLPPGTLAPELSINSIGENLIHFNFVGASGDRQLEFSNDLTNWEPTNLYVSPDTNFDFPFPKSPNQETYFRLSSSLGEYVFTSSIPTVSGKTLEGPYLFFKFNQDSTGVAYYPTGSASTGSEYLFTWSEDNNPGITTVNLVYLDGYTEYINIQELLNPLNEIDYFGSLTSTEGEKGKSYFTPFFDFSNSSAPIPSIENLAPEVISAGGYEFRQTGEATFTVFFHSDGTTAFNGPAISDGSISVWTYEYFKTGANTATLEVTDFDGDFTRLFLTFDSNGSVNASASSAEFENPFGRTDSFFEVVPLSGSF